MFDILGLEGCERNMVFDTTVDGGGAGWHITKFEVQESTVDEGDGIGDYKGFSVAWEAAVAVYCTCTCPHIKHGTRVFDQQFNYEFWIQKAGEMPFEIPTPAEFLGAIGEAVASSIESNMPRPASISNTDANQIENMINRSKPTVPTAGEWVGGKSPCGK